MFFFRSVLGDKASVVEQVPNFLKIGHQHTTGRGPVKKGIIFGELNLFFFSFFWPGYVGVFVAHFHICFLLEVS